MNRSTLQTQFYRPVASSPARTKIPRETGPQRSAVRRPINPDADDTDPEEDGFLRARRRVPVRRGLIPSSLSGRITAASGVIVAIILLVVVAIGIRNFFRDDPRFRIADSSSIQIMGNTLVTRPELLSVFGSDLGRNVFYIPLASRRKALEDLPWVEHATVMRLLPDQLRVAIIERTPIAFVRTGSTIGLVDGNGVFLHLLPAVMAARHYSFPVVTGIAAKDALSQRAARMHLYQQFIADLDAGGTKVSNQISEVDLTDAEDVAALLPAQGSDIQVHFGNSDFLARYRSYQQHLTEWRQQYPHLSAVDLRYENQVVLDMAPQANSAAVRDADAASLHHAPAPAIKHAAHPIGKPAVRLRSPNAAKKAKRH